MKLSFLSFILLCAAIFSSCHKSIQPPQHFDGKVLPGIWELRAVIGGPVLFEPNYRPGNGNQWAFTQTEFASRYKDTVYRSGTYSISRGTGTDLNTGRQIDQFVLNNEPAESFELKNDTLRLYYGAIYADGVINMYVKIADGL